MSSRTWIVALALVAAPLVACEDAAGEGGTPGTGTELDEGASGPIEREHPGLEQTEQPIPPPGELDRDDDDWGVQPATP